jgi:hypothetical protein
VADVFEEVEEQLRLERYKSIALRALPWLLGATLLAVVAAGGLWGWNSYRVQQASKASDQYAAALKAFDQGRADEAVRLWTEVSKSPSKGYGALALMQLGGIKVSDGKPAEAAKLFDAAARAAPDAVIGDVARLKAAFALLDTSPYKEIETRLTPLTQDGRPYRATAREALAFSKLATGDLAGARSDFKVLTLLADASEGARARAQAAIVLIDSGSAKAVPAAIRAATALPPQVSVPKPAPPAPQPQATGPQ